MTISAKFDFSDVTAYAKKLGASRRQIKLETQKLAVGVANEAKDLMQVYPPKRPNFPFRFVSGKQRRWFFWALRTGQITVPYQRTGKLKRGWRTETRGSSGRAFQARVLNRVSYAEYVQGQPEQQNPGHRDWWRSVNVLDYEFPLIYERRANQTARRLKDLLSP